VTLPDNLPHLDTFVAFRIFSLKHCEVEDTCVLEKMFKKLKQTVKRTKFKTSDIYIYKYCCQRKLDIQ
jgi:intergrase/recombinase